MPGVVGRTGLCPNRTLGKHRAGGEKKAYWDVANAWISLEDSLVERPFSRGWPGHRFHHVRYSRGGSFAAFSQAHAPTSNIEPRLRISGKVFWDVVWARETHKQSKESCN